ncbi:MAG TPA: FGGY family carbohydrate kinase, partial [Phycisphaeraceae bacterium]
MTAQGCVAFDLGAESGRAVLAAFDGSKITLQEVHRFANGPQRLPQGYHWNILELWANLQAGLRRAAAQARQEELELAHLGVDTWGVDYALVGRSGQILGLPWAYRDPRHAVGMQQALEQVGAKALYEATGVQFLPFNTLFQLLALRQAEPGLLDQARRLLFIPDLLHYFFTGQRVNEATIASTSQMIDPRSGAWHAKLLQDLGLPTHFLEEAIVPAGTRIGPLRPEVAQEAGVGAMEVIAPGSHDTASAVAAVPVDASATPRWAYLSSGTWSLMGVEREAPLLSDAAREANFTNERGVCGKIRFLKNIAGLWLVQEVRRDLAQQGQELDYPQLTRLAEQAPPFATLVNPDHA